MAHVSPLLTLAGIWAVVVVSPGPCFVATVQAASRGARRDGVFVALGVAAGTLIWCTGSVLGLAVLFARFGSLYRFVRMAGALSLAYLGVRMILNARHAMPSRPTTGGATGVSALRMGFLTDISNPKAAVFFGSLFSTLLPPHAPFWMLTTAIAVVLVIEFTWYCIVAWLFSLSPVAAAYRRAKRVFDRLTGGLFLLLGVRLAAAK